MVLNTKDILVTTNFSKVFKLFNNFMSSNGTQQLQKEAEEMKRLKKKKRERETEDAKRKKAKMKKNSLSSNDKDVTVANKVSWTATNSTFSPVHSELPSEPMGMFWTRPRRG